MTREQRRWKSSWNTTVRALNVGIVTLVAFSILAITLVPADGSQKIEDPFCIVCGERGLADLVLNLFLFIPLGTFLSRLGWRTRAILLACVLASGVIETLQLALPGRTPSVRDILANVVGGLLGTSVIVHGGNWSRPGRLATNSFIMLVLLSVAVVYTTGWLLSIAPRGEQAIFSQWAPRFANTAHWNGQIQSVLYNGEPLPSGKLPLGAPSLASTPLSGRIKLSLLASSMPVSPAPIFGIADMSGNHLILIGQDKADLILTLRRRSTILRLNAPELRFRGALAGARPGDPLVLNVYGIGRPAPCVEISGHAACSRESAAGRAWALLIYRSSWPQLAVSALDSLMFAMLGLPVGFFLLSVHRALAGGGLLILTFCIPFAASLGELAMPSFLEALGLGIGLTVGSLLATRASPGRAPSGCARPSVSSIRNVP